MADNQYSRKHANRIEDLPENDPLAELARIVGFDSQPSNHEGVVRPGSRVEPAIDLEEELLREFEAFDVSSRYGAAPRPEPANPPLTIADRAYQPDALPGEEPESGDPYEALLEDELLRDIEGRGEFEADAAEPAFDRFADEPASGAPHPDPFARQDDQFAAFDDERAESAEPDFADLAVEELNASEPEAVAYGEPEESPAVDRGIEDEPVAAEPSYADEQENWPAPAEAVADESGEPDFDFSFDEADFAADDAEVDREESLSFAEYRDEEPADAPAPLAEDDAPFISLNHHDLDRIDAAAGEHVVDAAALEEELAAELKLSGLDVEPRFEPAGEVEESEFHPRALFDPKGDGWQENAGFENEAPADEAQVQGTPVEPVAFEPASLDDASIREESPPFDEPFSFDEMFDGTDEAATPQEPAANPAAPAGSSDDILADIARFQISADGHDEPQVASAGRSAAHVGEADSEPAEAAESGLDAWLREMGLDQPVRGRAAVPAESGAAWTRASNIVPLHGHVNEAEAAQPEEVEAAAPEDDPWAMAEPEAPAAESEEVDGLHAALEADLAAAYEEMLSEPEFGRDRPEEPEALYLPEAEERDTSDELPAQREPRRADPFPSWSPVRPVDATPQYAAAQGTAFAPEQESVSPAEESEPPAAPRFVAPPGVAAGFEAFDFDPASLSDTEEPVELAPELEIPRLPNEDEPATAVAADDFDLDLEGDFGELLGETKEEAAPEQGASNQASMAAAGAAAFGLAAHEARGAEQPTANPSSWPSPTSRAPILEGEGEEGFGEDFDTDLSRPREFGGSHQASALDMPPPPAARFMSRRGMRLGAGVAALVLVAGAGAFAWNGHGASGEAGSGGPRIITADAKPVKQKPANPGGKQVPNQNKIVYDSVDGTAAQAPQQKNLVTSAEQPADVVQRTLDPDVLPLGNPERTRADAAAKQRATPTEAGKGQDRLAADATPGASPEAAAPRGIEPQRVETMVVTADGKLVPRDPGNAPAAAKASANPANAAAHSAGSAAETAAAGPAVPASGVAAAPLAPPSASANPVQAPVPTIRPEPQAVASAPAAPAAPAAQPAATPPAAQPPQPSASGSQPADTAAATPQQAAPANPGGYFIQIASQPTEAGAKASYQNLSRRYDSVIGGHGVDIQRAEISGKGVYYRVRVAAGSHEQAVSMCESYKSAGGSCFVTR